MREDSLKDPSKPMSKSTIDTFKELWDTIREEASAFSFGLVESDVVDPILSNYIEPESVDTKGEKISDKIINGVYLNAIKESKTDFIPVVSMLQLMHFSEHKYDPLDFAVNDLVEGDLMAAFRGEPFDEFMVHWERVFHECRRLHAQSGRGKWEMRLGDFYSGSMSNAYYYVVIIAIYFRCSIHEQCGRTM